MQSSPDICFPVRRALLLRSMLGLVKDEKLHIDKGLLNVFLEIEEYRHGARSLETLATLTMGVKTGSLMRSDLPPEEQMSIHVDYTRFMNILKRDLPFKMHAEFLAPYIHDFYLQLNRKVGREPRYNMPYDKLPADIQSDNIAAAIRLPEVLYLAGLKVVPRITPTASPSRKSGLAWKREWRYWPRRSMMGGLITKSRMAGPWASVMRQIGYTIS